MRRNIAICALLACTVMAGLAPAAGAVNTHEVTFGSSGSAAGQLNAPSSIAYENSTGHVYVAESGNNRIQEFDATGTSVRIFGYDVVSSGPGNKPNKDEIQTVTIKAVGGAFVLFYEGERTIPIAFNAPASGAGSVEDALNALPSIGAGGVSVSGGPGDATGSTPYVVTFDGGLVGGTDTTQLTIEGRNLGQPTGTLYTCDTSGGSTTEYQWLRDGAPIPGATSSTYTSVAEDAGKALQCSVFASYDGGTTGRIAVNQTPMFGPGAPTGAPLHPLPSEYLYEPYANESLVVGGPGGQILTCSGNSYNQYPWANNPTTYTYNWYRNGKQLLESDTKAATEDTYTVTAGDVASHAIFQCVITANNSAGSSTKETTGAVYTQGFFGSHSDPFHSASVQPPIGSGSSTATSSVGGAVYEVCIPVAPSNDVCKAGTAGQQSGQFSEPRGVAVDNSASPSAGSIYVQDNGNRRIQKFTPAAALDRMWGSGVNQTTSGNLCVAGSGDICREGSNVGDPAPGGFNWPNSLDEQGVAVDPTGNVYVVDRPDSSTARIVRFDSLGSVLDQIQWTGDVSNWTSLAIDPVDADIYAVALFGGIAKFDSADFSAEGTTATRNLVIPGASTPWGAAVDPTNQYLQVGDRNVSGAACGGGSSNYALLAYDTAGNEADCTKTVPPYQIAGSSQSRGLAVSPSRRLYVADRSAGNIMVFALPSPSAPSFTSEAANISTTLATLRAFINPNFADTTYSIEFGPAPCTEVENPCSVVDSGGPLRGTVALTKSVLLENLTPGTVYHYRVIAQNSSGKTVGPQRTFKTFATPPADTCDNALARQQTGSSLLLDCRAYELVSAEYSGGYDVRSDVVPGQEPYGGFSMADDRVLYSTLDGGIPDSGGFPTNRGPDPYLATRGESGWSTAYVGIPANVTPVTPPFSSTVAEATPDLGTFAFGGPEICDPCFTTGIETGMPLRMPDGTLIQGMAGPLLPAAGSEAAGFVRRHFSANGDHFLFASTAKFHADGNGNGTDLTIYDRDLSADTTQVVSKLPNGATMTGSAADVAALDISENGSRVLVGKRVSTDPAGNRYWDLYMHFGTSPNSVAVIDTLNGALFNGMSSDGSEVFFTTADNPGGGDADTSPDLFRAQVSEGGATVTRLSTGTAGTGNSNLCDPVPNAGGNNWNAVGGASPNTCGTVAIADDGGLARDSGDVYFLSPEKLDGASNGVQDQPNLYYVTAGGAAPRFVAALEPENPIVLGAVADNDVRRTADFQVTPQGTFAVFGSRLQLEPSYDNGGKRMVYRYDTQADTIECASCIQTAEVPSGDASLASNGLSVSDDGRVFFNSPDALVLRDTSAKQDAYEWNGDEVQLISTGTSPFPASLLTVTHDGRDAFFFTRDEIVPSDRNGSAMKIYDAREQGGFFVIPSSPPCAASDECHGPSSAAAPTPQIGTFKTNGSNGQQSRPRCPKGKVRRRGKCVKKKKKSRGSRRATKNSQGGSR